MLSEKLMDALESLQGSINLEQEKKLAYDLATQRCYERKCDDCSGNCTGGCGANYY